MSKETLVGRGESKEQLSPQPYIVSGDIVPLLKGWANSKGFVLPSAEFFDQLRGDFSQFMRQIFPGFEFVHEDELTQGLRQIVIESGLHPISLDRVYYPTNPSLEIARLVDMNKKDMGLGKRPGTPPLVQQLGRLSIPNNDVVLVDDVIFTGDLLEKVARILSKRGIRVSLICAGIGIGEGIEKLTEAGYSVRCVRTYGKVIDEICERDFYPGVPLSGRVLAEKEDVGVPYILPFGNPGKWASIPTEWQESLSRFCLKQTIKLFEAIEAASEKPVLCQDLERKVLSLPMGNTRYVKELAKFF